MIRPGRRRRAGPPELDWHLRLAAGRRRRLRARRGAWTGLAAAAVGAIWVMAGGPAWVTPALAVLGAVAGATVPVRGSEGWARRWIGDRHGLGYDTALEAEGRPDPHGLWAASRERARLGLRGARPPATQHWWLPPAIAAALLIVASPWLAAIPRPSAPASQGDAAEARGAERQPGASTPSPEGDTADPSGAEGATAPAERPDRATGDDAPPPDERDTPVARDEEDGGDAAANGDGETAATGGAAVDRFLRDLESAGEPERELTNPFDPAGRRAEGEGRPQDREGGRATSEDVPPRTGGAESETGQATDAPSDGTPEGGAAPDRTGSDADDGATAGTEGDEASDRASEDGDASGDGGPGPRERTAAGEENGAPGDDGASDRSEPDDGGVLEGQRGDGADAVARDGRDEGDDGALDRGAGEAGDGRGADGRNGDEAGAGGEAAGAEPGAQGEPQPFLGGPDAAAERLSGPLGEGATPSVGSVRGGGQAPSAVPEGAPVDPSYGRAAERAADEAGLPGAYREIIRRYFR